MVNFLIERFGAGGYIGEHLWLGHVGHFLLLLSFFASLLSFVSYFCAEYAPCRRDELSWRTLSRVSFFTHGMAVLGVFVLLFIMILNHWFEYHYAWRHSSKELPVQYIISSFWEGQEGSFLLWQFWIVVLGFLGWKVLKSWEYPVMGILALTQFFLGSMVLGIYVGSYKIGSSPFVLLRDEMAEAPIFQRADYLKFIEDGNGLNPLLQNYWMTIHPPVLFLGFASVSVPFAFVVASLLRKDFTAWVKPALPWVLFSIAVLGAGILMGGAWAYESLSFGGFWAWDPVENMSLVPWLLLVAGLHTHLIFKNTGYSLLSTFLFYILSFVTVLYSTFLTRSGILGDTSVHAFTDLGMSGQLLIYMGAFSLPAMLLLAFRYPSIPKKDKEEEWLTREFWMFIASLIMLLSAVQMIFTTSIPVWNKLFGLQLAPPENVVQHYNNIQIWIGILAALLTATIQYLAYKTNRLPAVFKWVYVSLALSLVISAALAWGMKIDFTEQYLIDGTEKFSCLFVKFPFISRYFLMLFASVYAVVGNSLYLFYILNNNWRMSGASITHLGFGLFLIGVLISQGKKSVISINSSGVDFGANFKDNEKVENVLLLKDSTTRMGDYWVSYRGSKTEGPNHYYIVEYMRKDKDDQVVESFQLLPNAQINPKMGLIANPATKHYLTKDIFTHVSSVPNHETLRDTTRVHELALGDTFFNLTSYTVFDKINTSPHLPEGMDADGKIVVAPVLVTKTLEGATYTSEPVYWIDIKNNNLVNTIPAHIEPLGLTFNVIKIHPEKKKFSISVREKEKPIDFIIMKALVFPYIGLVWLGGIITFAGILWSAYRRYKTSRYGKND
jgi:cytochrome c-type biogenesis protein CcmF